VSGGPVPHLPPRVALVTGASRGIGRAVALALADDGCAVAVHYRQAAERAAETVAAIRAAGGRAEAFAADLSAPDQAEKLAAAVAASLGPIDVLVSNAGVRHTQFLQLTSLDQWRATLATNLDAAFLLAKAAARAMSRRRSGRIVLISSDAALLGDALNAAYSASKAGLLGLARSAARELAPMGVTVNVVAPGTIETDMTAALDGARRARQVSAIPMGRLGRPEEVAAVVRFLCSEDAAYITGQILSVDGGLCTRG
jgi:3-oxoacyl-[acyl-carrier protein] reductase